MNKTYQYCVACGNAQTAKENCAKCGSMYLAERDTVDYEVHLFDDKSLMPKERPDVIPSDDPKYHDTNSALPPSMQDLRPIGSDKHDQDVYDQDPLQNLQSGDREVIDQKRETWTRTGDPKTTRLTLWDKNVKDIDVDPKNYSTKNDGHERPADGPHDQTKAVPAPVGGSMDKKPTVAVYPGKPGRENDDSFMDPHAGGPTTYQELQDNLKTPPSSETEKVYPGNPNLKPDTYMDPYHNAGEILEAWLDADDAELLRLSERKTKTVSGQHLTANQFACVGDASKTDTWKLPIHDANHVRNALARYNQTEGCSTAKVKAKILRAAKKFGIKVSPGTPVKADYTDHVINDTQNRDSFMDPHKQGTSDITGPEKVPNPTLPEPEHPQGPGTADQKATESDPHPNADTPHVTIKSADGDDPHHVKPDVDTRDVSNYSATPAPMPVSKEHADPSGVHAPSPIKHDSFDDSLPSEAITPIPNSDNLTVPALPTYPKPSHTAEATPEQEDEAKKAEITPQQEDKPATINIKDDQASRKAAKKASRKVAIAKMQAYIKPTDNYLAPDKKGNADMLPNVGSDEEKPNYAKPTNDPDGKDMKGAAGVPTTRTPGADNINEHFVNITDKDGAPQYGVPSATSLNTQYGVITPKVRTDENKTVVVKEADDYKGDGDKPADSTTRGPDADRVDTNKTLEVKDVKKEQNDLENRKVVGYKAIHLLKFSKSFWKNSDGVLAFLANEGIDYAYRIDPSGKVVSKITEAAGYFEVEALPAANFKAGSMVEHCIANFGGDCAIIAVSGEVASTPEPTHLKYGEKVDALAVASKVGGALGNHYYKMAQKLAKELTDVKAELAEKMAQAKLESRLSELPRSVRAQLNKNPDKDSVFQFLRTASEPEWNLARHTFALANRKSFVELSEEEGKLPVGGGTANDTKGNLKQYLR